MVVNIYFNVGLDVVKQILCTLKFPVEETSKEEFYPIFDKIIDYLFVGNHIDDSNGMLLKAVNGLKDININFVGELVQCTESSLLKTANLGRKSLLAIKTQLAKHGLTLGMAVDGWKPQKIK